MKGEKPMKKLIRNPIYIPKGRAKEYGDFALNIYKGCTHQCSYCYAAKMFRKTPEEYAAMAAPRENIVESVAAALEKGKVDGITLNGKLIHLCFTCDPYPRGIDTTPTREIIKLIKDSGNHVQILTKAAETPERDFDLMDENDWYGITLSGSCDRRYERMAAIPRERCETLMRAKEHGIKTWISFEPVIDQFDVEVSIMGYRQYIDKIKIGMPNHVRGGVIDKNLAPTPWGKWGERIERMCQHNGIDYYIKDGLRAEIEKYQREER